MVLQGPGRIVSVHIYVLYLLIFNAGFKDGS